MSFSSLSQELVDMVIDEVHLCDTTSQDIPNCALTSKGFVRRCQGHIFRGIFLDSDLDLARNCAPYRPSPKNLEAVLSETPHLAPMVKAIMINPNCTSDAALPSILNMLTNLMSFALDDPVRPDKHQPICWMELSTELQEALIKAISSKAMNSLSISKLTEAPDSLFQTSPSLQLLALRDVTCTPCSARMPDSPHSRARLLRLGIASSLETPPWMPSQEFENSVDVTHLQLLNVLIPMKLDPASTFRIQHIIDVNQACLTKLTFSYPHRTGLHFDFSLNSLPALEILVISFGEPLEEKWETNSWLVAVLDSLPPSARLRSVDTHVTCVNHHDTDFSGQEHPQRTKHPDWARLDSLLMGERFMKMVAFRYICRTIQQTQEDVEYCKDGLSLCLPQITARGILFSEWEPLGFSPS